METGGRPVLLVEYECAADKCAGRCVLDAYRGPPRCHGGGAGTSTAHPPTYMRAVGLAVPRG